MWPPTIHRVQWPVDAEKCFGDTFAKYSSMNMLKKPPHDMVKSNIWEGIWTFLVPLPVVLWFLGFESWLPEFPTRDATPFVINTQEKLPSSSDDRVTGLSHRPSCEDIGGAPGKWKQANTIISRLLWPDLRCDHQRCNSLWQMSPRLESFREHFKPPQHRGWWNLAFRSYLLVVWLWITQQRWKRFSLSLSLFSWWL